MLRHATFVICCLTLVACGGGGKDATAPKHTAARVSRIWTDGGPCAAGVCTFPVHYVTSDNLTDENIPWDVQITGNGTHPATGKSGANGQGDFTWGSPMYPTMAYVTVCPIESAAPERCKSLVLNAP